MDEYDGDLGEWEGVIHHKNRRQSGDMRHKRPSVKSDQEAVGRKPHKSWRPSGRHPDPEY